MRAPSDGIDSFRPRPPWWTGDLQTVRNAVVRPRVDLSSWPEARLWLPVQGGDWLAAALHAGERIGHAPPVVLIHGLCGCEDSAYVRASTRFWLSQGHPVLRLNLRGSWPSRPHCAGHYHAGRSEDPAAALRALIQRQPAIARTGVVVVGYSLGGNLLIKLLAEAGRELPIRAAATVSAPIDLAATTRRFNRLRNAPYRWWLLTLMKREALAPPAEISDAERAAIDRARTPADFDDGFIAPRFGFGDCWDYYARCSGERFLPAVPLPLLLIHAADDPWIPVGPYERVHWDANPNLTPVLTPGGGHVGFHAAGDGDPWHDRRIAAFLADL
ncbi:hypothetical protein SAMN05216241_1026 [Limimonas halophila]|uniref:AB hydrolase-1 domain-containing protein n=1 Tax=Limimonas halophila TaxID=1082479 RepID=A0A1G7N300_9PROT|nr:alpha/beta fold hydrolase [Limimonas halophila]SDF68423.1 hypothetical protein SAMN05216241_1026 [Limimonas halophila]